MQRARQGVDVAVHCDEALLSTGALLDFRAHVEGLLARGDRAGALALWESVVVFIHEPLIPDAEFVIGGLPPLAECPAWSGGAAGAGRALWHWLGGLAGGVEFFPPVCVLCSVPTFATRNDRSVCPDCSSNFGLGSS